MDDLSHSNDQITSISFSRSTTETGLSAQFCESDIDSTLEKLRETARERAQEKHAEMKLRRKKPEVHVMKKTNKLLTKRQISSKKSAEICRIKAQIYTGLLEQAVYDVEEQQKVIRSQLLAQKTVNATLKSRVANLKATNDASILSSLEMNVEDPTFCEQPHQFVQCQDDSTLKAGNDPSLSTVFCDVRRSTQTEITTAANDMFLPEVTLDDLLSFPSLTKQVEDDTFTLQTSLWNESENLSLSPVTTISSEPFSPSLSVMAVVDALR